MGPDPYAPFLPRIAARWPAGRSQIIVDGTLVFADVSGFTALSERLARRGKIGAELMADLLDAVFEQLLDIALDLDGDLLAFGGDALCLLFTGAGHEIRGATTAWELQRGLRRRTAAHAAIGRVTLGMSIGAEAGPIHLVRAGSEPAEFLALGATVSATLGYEGIAERGEILIGRELATRLPAPLLEQRNEHAYLGRAPLGPTPVDLDAVAGAVEPGIAAGWLREVIDAGTIAEHRPATIGFVKVLGTDAVIERNDGPAVIDHVVEAVQAIADRSGVTVVAADVYPDAIKILTATGVPSSSPDDTERMLRAGLGFAAIDSPLTLHVGINRGRVFAGPIGAPRRRTYTVIGDAVNLAARLMARAPSGQVIATDQTLAASRRRFSRTPIEPFMVKGKVDPINAATVGLPEAGSAPSAVAFGRDAEGELLRTAWSRVERGTGEAVLVSAPPGMGKSTLLRELRSRIPESTPTAVIEGGIYSRASPYRALIPTLLGAAGIDESAPEAQQGRELLALITRTAPDLVPWAPLLAIAFGIELPPTAATEAVAPEFRRQRLADIFVKWMSAQFPTPTVFLVEDAHWIDDASAELLHALARSVVDHQWLVVFSRRPTNEGVQFDPETLTTIELGPIDESAARALVAELTRDALPEPTIQALIDRADGNPLLLTELVNAAASGRPIDELPESVESLVGAEIDTLPAGERALLRRAAVLGMVFPAALLRELAGTDPPSIATLSRFLFSDGEAIRFRHALLRDAAYEGLSYRERVRLHGDAAQHLESVAGSAADEAAELLSLHHFHAHSWARALHYSIVAADRARSDLAPVEAAAFYRRAIESARRSRTGPDVRLSLEESLAGVLERSGLYRDARASLTRARRLAGDPQSLARLLLATGRIEEAMARYSQALRCYSRALAVIDAPPTDLIAADLGAKLEIERAGIMYRQGKYRRCVQLLESAFADVLQTASKELAGRAHYLLDVAQSELDEAGDHEHAHAAIQLLQACGDLGGEASVWNNLGVEAYFAGDLDAARSHYQRCADLSRRIGDVVQEATAVNNIGEVLSDQGRLDEAQTEFEHARRVFLGAAYTMGAAVATSNLGRVAIRQGRLDAAGPLLADASSALVAIGALSLAREVEGRRAEMLLALDRPEEALVLIEAVMAKADDAGERAVLAESLAELADQARRRLEHVRASAPDSRG